MSGFAVARQLDAHLCIAGLLLPLPALALPGFAEVKASYVFSEATLLARDGQLIHRLRLDKTVRRQAWTPSRRDFSGPDPRHHRLRR